MVSQMKVNSFLVINELPERISLYLVREFDDEPSKIGHFQISKSIFGVKCDLFFQKQKFLFEYQITVVEKTNGTGRDLCSKWPILTKL